MTEYGKTGCDPIPDLEYNGSVLWSRQQQFDPLADPLQSQLPLSGLPKRINPLIIAAAQPTPASTEIALQAQFFAHAPHSIHASRSTTRTVSSRICRTARGHTSKHIPQPVHLSSLTDTVATLRAYLKEILLLPSVPAERSKRLGRQDKKGKPISTLFSLRICSRSASNR